MAFYKTKIFRYVLILVCIVISVYSVYDHIIKGRWRDYSDEYLYSVMLEFNIGLGKYWKRFHSNPVTGQDMVEQKFISIPAGIIQKYKIRFDGAPYIETITMERTYFGNRWRKYAPYFERIEFYAKTGEYRAEWGMAWIKAEKLLEPKAAE